MENENAVYELFKQLPRHPELITAENVVMLPAAAWCRVLIFKAQDSIQTADMEDELLAEPGVWRKDDYDNFISFFDRWAEIPQREWYELLMWYPALEKHCPEEILKEIRFIEATGHPSSYYEDLLEEEQY